MSFYIRGFKLGAPVAFVCGYTVGNNLLSHDENSLVKELKTHIYGKAIFSIQLGSMFAMAWPASIPLSIAYMSYACNLST